MKKRHQLDVLSICLAIGCLYCLGFSVRSVRYVGGQYLPTHNAEFALLAAILALAFVLVRVRVRKLMRSETQGFPILPRKNP